MGTNTDLEISEQIAHILKVSLNSAINETFFISSVIVALAVVVTMFLTPTPVFTNKRASKDDMGS